MNSKVLKNKKKVPVFISVANLIPYKDYFTVINVLNLIRQESIDFHYFILGYNIK